MSQDNKEFLVCLAVGLLVGTMVAISGGPQWAVVGFAITTSAVMICRNGD